MKEKAAPKFQVRDIGRDPDSEGTADLELELLSTDGIQRKLGQQARDSSLDKTFQKRKQEKKTGRQSRAESRGGRQLEDNQVTLT